MGDSGAGAGSWTGRALAVVTGASRGFGRSLSALLAPRLEPGSVLVLTARSGEALDRLDGELRPACPGVTLRPVVADLARQEGLRTLLDACSDPHVEQPLRRLLIVNNADKAACCLLTRNRRTTKIFFPGHKAIKEETSWKKRTFSHPAWHPLSPTGSLGDVSKSFLDFTSPAEVTSYLDFNVSSALCLTAALLKAFPAQLGLIRTVVNVSSLCALQPFKSWTLYCTGKAARDMMFRVLAAEEPDVRVLNYAPGPLDTQMQEVARSRSGDPELRQQFLHMKQSGTLLDCDVSAEKLLGLLRADTFESGAHIDFYDA